MHERNPKIDRPGSPCWHGDSVEHDTAHHAREVERMRARVDTRDEHVMETLRDIVG